jgi:hypothetical protein
LKQKLNKIKTIYSILFFIYTEKFDAKIIKDCYKDERDENPAGSGEKLYFY